MLLTSKFIIFKIKNYDNSENSFKEINTWLNEIKNNSSPDIKKFLIGNKADLEDKRRLTKEQGEQLCNDHKLAFFMETSAKTGFNVQNVFIQVAKELYLQHEEIKNRVSRPGSWSATISIQEDPNKLILETEDEESRKPKKKCCFL